MKHLYDLNILTTRWREFADGAWPSLRLAVISRALFACMHPLLLVLSGPKDVFSVSHERIQGKRFLQDAVSHELRF